MGICIQRVSRNTAESLDYSGDLHQTGQLNKGQKSLPTMGIHIKAVSRNIAELLAYYLDLHKTGSLNNGRNP